MWYQNKTNKFLGFRAHNQLGVACVVSLPPDAEFETDREINISGLELVIEEELVGGEF